MARALSDWPTWSSLYRPSAEIQIPYRHTKVPPHPTANDHCRDVRVAGQPDHPMEIGGKRHCRENTSRRRRCCECRGVPTEQLGIGAGAAVVAAHSLGIGKMHWAEIFGPCSSSTIMSTSSIRGTVHGWFQRMALDHSPGDHPHTAWYRSCNRDDRTTPKEVKRHRAINVGFANCRGLPDTPYAHHGAEIMTHRAVFSEPFCDQALGHQSTANPVNAMIKELKEDLHAKGDCLGFRSSGSFFVH